MADLRVLSGWQREDTGKAHHERIPTQLTGLSKMRATNDRLAEKYIVVVARELAKALKGLHAAGIIHRDVKGKPSCCGFPRNSTECMLTQFPVQRQTFSSMRKAD